MKNKSLLAALLVLALLGAALFAKGVWIGLLVASAFAWSDGSNSDEYSRLFGLAFRYVIGAVVAFGAAFIVFRKVISQSKPGERGE